MPGAQVGLLTLGSSGDADIRVQAIGVTSLSTGVAVTPETLFQYGSISKVWTTTLIMQLVDEGRLDLDTRVVDVLPEFALADPDAAALITVRQLLTHTSGIDGDVFTDTGDGDDCIAAYVRQLRTAVSVTEPGGPLSYCNTGFVIAGRLVEVLRGQTWDDALAEHLLRPLGLTHVISRASDAPLFRTAVGHIATDPASPEVSPATAGMLPRSLGPAGLVSGSADSLLRFAAAHLRDGLSLTGVQIVSTEAARQMRQAQVDLTGLSTTEPAWGLGWHHQRWGAKTAVAHGGVTIGQIADLQLFPERGLALAVLANSTGGHAFIGEVRALLADELGVTAPTPRIEPHADQLDLSELAGVYESTTLRWQLECGNDDRLVLTVTDKQPVSGEAGPEPTVVVPVGPGRFVVAQEGRDVEVTHLRHAGTSYLYLGRLLERTAGAT